MAQSNTSKTEVLSTEGSFESSLSFFSLNKFLCPKKDSGLSSVHTGDSFCSTSEWVCLNVLEYLLQVCSSDVECSVFFCCKSAHGVDSDKR